MSLEFTWISPQNLNWKYLFIAFHTPSMYALVQSKRPKESCHFPVYTKNEEWKGEGESKHTSWMHPSPHPLKIHPPTD